MNTEQKVQYVLDRFDIQDVITKYSFGQDLHQGSDDRVADVWKDVFTPDAKLEYSAAGSPSPISYSEMIKIMRGDGTKEGNMTGPFTNWQHLVGNPVVTIEGDNAKSRVDLWATHKGKVFEGAPAYSLYVAGAFEDELVRTDKGWRISTRKLILHFMDMHHTAPMPTA